VANAGHVGTHAFFPVLLMQHPEMDAQIYQTIHTNIKKCRMCYESLTTKLFAKGRAGKDPIFFH